ncbi:hypothetical protein ROSEINA2194_01358 [Roseburia inulinivorans DSM 16841]|uniref:Uncharacterized protein n=1 Tax=Roseburia inulinivorans DSM 16841 TaxID=622312 RepID=C0FRJ6_9FIRM|nr:hypothetical protein ROSEINA2194_01358 [Roseburia inulinivorans DSM 16841]
MKHTISFFCNYGKEKQILHGILFFPAVSVLCIIPVFYDFY